MGEHEILKSALGRALVQRDKLHFVSPDRLCYRDTEFPLRHKKKMSPDCPKHLDIVIPFNGICVHSDHNVQEPFRYTTVSVWTSASNSSGTNVSSSFSHAAMTPMGGFVAFLQSELLL